MLTRFRRLAMPRTLAQSAALLAVVVFAATATAQNPDMTATFQGSSPKVSFAFKWKDEKHTRNVGILNWDIPLTDISTSGFDRNFRTFCAEALVGVVAGQTYRFELQ